MSYRRWYDVDPRLSAVVHAMEDLNRDSQIYMAQKILELSESLLVDLGGEEYLKGLDEKKQAGLDKAGSNKNRWYDRDERLHRAFKNLYALPNTERRDIAIRLATPIQIVEGYEKHCARQGSAPEMRIIEEILRSSFVQGSERARKLYSVYLHDFSATATPERSHDKASKDSNSGSLWSHLLRSLQEAMA